MTNYDEYILFCNNGIGDKILDIIGIITYCTLKKYNIKIILNHIIKKYSFGIENFYNINFFEFENLQIENYYEDLINKNIFSNENIISNKFIILDERFNKKSLKYNNKGLDNKPEDYDIPDVIKNETYPIIYYTPVITFNPINIYEKLNELYTLEDISNLYIKISESIKPSKLIESFIPNEINNSYGIHLRRSDKIKSNEVYDLKKINNYNIWVNSNDEYLILINKIKNLIIELIKNNENSSFFVCSEDNEYKNYFENWIIENNGKIININIPNYEVPPEFLAIVELFTLSRCKSIIQGIKYSSFSLVASLMSKNKNIINFYEDDDNNLINIFKTCLNINNKAMYNLNICRNICKNYLKINF